jgi:hypothetical protein
MGPSALIADHETGMTDETARFRRHDAHQITRSKVRFSLPKRGSRDDRVDSPAEPGLRVLDGLAHTVIVHRWIEVPVLGHVEKVPS